jgi:hypothetical protein
MTFLLAEETVFQQQVRELWSIGSSLTIIWILLAVLVLVGMACLARLSRLRNIGRAILEEQQKANKMLQYLNEREYEKAKGKAGEKAATGGNVQRPTPNVQSRMTEKAEPEVYRID